MLRVFAPPEDRVRDIFHGAQSNPAQERKMREMEKKRAYAAELQAQMREKEHQRQLDRMQRLGLSPATNGSAGPQGPGAVPANFPPPQAHFVTDSLPATDLATAAVAWPNSAAAFASSPQQSGVQGQLLQPPGAGAMLQQHQQAQSWHASRPPPGANFAPSYTSSPNSYDSPNYAYSVAAEPAGPPYQEQMLSAPPGGWAGASLQPPTAQPPAYIPHNYPVANAGSVVQGSQPYLAMSIAGQPSAYGTASLYSGPGFYGGAAGTTTSPSWGQQPADYPAAGASNASSIYGARNNMYEPAAAGGAQAAYRTQAPAWSPTPVAVPVVPGAGATAAAAAAKSKKDAYRAELEQQIRDKAARKAAEKSAIDAEEARKEAEQAGYNPWGRAGAGAPLRDAEGQVVSNIRGGRQPMQPYSENRQVHLQAYAGPVGSSTAATAAQPSGYWSAAADAGSQDSYQQQQVLDAAAGSGAATAAPGHPPLLNFRSDKAFMTADEVDRRQRAQLELQKELDQQIQEKKRRKELERQQAEEEAHREEVRLAAEQARLTAQFQQEQDKEKAKANQAADVEEQVAGAWTAAKAAAAHGRRKTMEERRRSHGQLRVEDPTADLQQYSSQQDCSQLHQNKREQQYNRQNSSSQQAAEDGLRQYQLPQQQERQQMMLEALRLEEEKMRQLAAQEVGRLRADMEAQASALRHVVDRQGGEVAALKAAAAAAEAESMAAKSELMQVRQDMLRRSQELQHETLSTILADNCSGPVSRVVAAYHPSPVRRIELDLPPPAASVRRSVQLQNAAAAASSASDGFPAAEREQSAVDLPENLLQQGKQPVGSYGAADVLSGGASSGWASSAAAHQAGNVRGSMLVSESTFIFPSGIPAEAGPAAVDEGASTVGLAVGDDLGATVAIHSSSSAMDVGNHWGLWQQQQPRLQRHTTSAPGSTHLAADREGPFAAADARLKSTAASRRSLVTPGGSDLTSLVDRNADRLQLLSSMPPPGDPEALDEFLAKFVSKTSQPNQRNIATPPSRLLSANGHTNHHHQHQQQQQHTVQLIQPPSNCNIAPRYGRNSDTTTAYPPVQGTSALVHAADAASSNLYLGIFDTLDQELSRARFGGGVPADYGVAAASAQQRLLAAGAVESSDAILGSSHWLPSVHTDL